MDTRDLHKKLARERDELLSELTALGIQNKHTPSDWIPTPAHASTAEADPNDLGDRSEDWQERRGTLDALETRYNNVLRALKKITNGTYGTCEICDELITTERLTVNPAARTCTDHLEADVPLTD